MNPAARKERKVAAPAPEALLAVDLAGLLHLSVRHVVNLPRLSLPLPLVVLALALGAEVVPDGHRQAVAEEIREAEDEDYGGAERRACDAGHHRERGDDAINRAIDHVTEVASATAGVDPLVYLLPEIGLLGAFEVLAVECPARAGTP